MAVKNQTLTQDYAIYNADCIEVMRDMPNGSIGYSVFSPPFADLYSYSDDPADLGNCKNYNEFFMHFRFVANELKRLIKPGRLISVHCIDIPAMKERDGHIGLKDFPGDIIRMFVDCGFIYHSRHVVWKDPLIEATRTKALGLMHKQLCKDSAMCRAGLPDYVLTFRDPGENADPITHGQGLTRYSGKDDPGGIGVRRSHQIWRKYASPIWMDVRQTRVLPYKPGRDPEDEKHICPLQLDTIERCVSLWSNPGEVVFTPFMGVGSEVYGAVINGRRAVGVELKESYYRQAVKNCQEASNKKTQDEMPLLSQGEES